MLCESSQGKRAKENLESIQKIMKGNVEKTGEKSINIEVSSSMLSETAKNGKPKENSFKSTELILAMLQEWTTIMRIKQKQRFNNL